MKPVTLIIFSTLIFSALAIFSLSVSATEQRIPSNTNDAYVTKPVAEWISVVGAIAIPVVTRLRRCCPVRFISGHQGIENYQEALARTETVGQ